MLDEKDLQAIHAILRKEIKESIPAIVDERVSKIIDERVPRIIDERVPAMIDKRIAASENMILRELDRMQTHLEEEIARMKKTA